MGWIYAGAYMKFPTYAEAVHNSHGEYVVDWDRGERKYKAVCSGVRVYENDLVQITRSGSNDPHWREHVKKEFDCRFVLLSELTHVVLQDPETRSRVHKKNLDGTLYWYDVERARLYKVGKWGSADISFVSKHAQPSVLDDIVYYLPNKAKEKAMHTALAEHMALGITLNALPGGDRYGTGRYGYSSYTQKILDFNEPVPSDLTAPKTQIFCKEIAKNPTNLTAYLRRSSRIKVTTKYINVVPK